MKRLFLLSMVALAICFASCSPYSVKSSGALNGRDLTTYKSFNLQKINSEELPKSIAEDDLIRLYRALGNQLAIRGYQYVDEGDADLTIHIGLSTKQSLETDYNSSGYIGVGAYGVGPGPGIYGGAPYGVGRYNYYSPVTYAHGYVGSSTATTELVTDGILIIDLVDNSDNTHVFCSQVCANIDGNKLILKNNEELAKVAEKAFKKYPVSAPTTK